MTTLFGYTLRFLRNRENLSAEALAKATGLGVTTIENIESGYIVPPDAVQEKLAGHFGVTVAYMKGSAEVWVPGVHAEEASVPQRYVRLRPVTVERLHTGSEARGATDAADVILPLPASDRSEYIAVQVTDNSMQRYRAMAGDLLIVREDTQKIRSGDLVLLLSDDGHALLRRYYREDGDVLLRSDNDDLLPPIRLSSCDATYRLIGTVIRILIEVDAAFLERRAQNPPALPDEILPPHTTRLSGSGGIASYMHEYILDK